MYFRDKAIVIQYVFVSNTHLAFQIVVFRISENVSVSFQKEPCVYSLLYLVGLSYQSRSERRNHLTTGFTCESRNIRITTANPIVRTIGH